MTAVGAQLARVSDSMDINYSQVARLLRLALAVADKVVNGRAHSCWAVKTRASGNRYDIVEHSGDGLLKLVELIAPELVEVEG